MPAFKKSILARMRRNGISVNAIARATGTSAAAVGKALSDFGLGRVKASRAPRKPRVLQADDDHGQSMDWLPSPEQMDVTT